MGNIQSEVGKFIQFAKDELEKRNFDAVITEGRNVPDNIRSYATIGSLMKDTIQVQSIKNLIECFNSAENPLLKDQKASDIVNSDTNPLLKNQKTSSINSKNIRFTDFDFTLQNDPCNSTPPFCFVCASSGAGKTQLPFALDTPVLYFLFKSFLTKTASKEEIGTQGVYLPFIKISTAFNWCLDEDYKLYKQYENLKNQENQEKLWKEKFYTIGFLVTLCRSIIKIRDNGHNDEHWIITELRVGNMDFEKMSILDGCSIIDELFANNKKSRPAIFIDESQRLPEENGDEFVEQYVFTRRLLRKSTLITFFMGTNASFVNFVMLQSKKSYQSRKGEFKPFCYVVHDLAPFSTIVLDKHITELKEIAYDSIAAPVPKAAIREIDEFLGFIRNLLTTERPWFCLLVLEYLKKNISFVGNFKPLDILDNIIYSIFSTFMVRKKEFANFTPEDSSEYNLANISLISPNLCKQISEISKEISNIEEANKKTKLSIEVKKDINSVPFSFIHKHVAYLRTSATIEEYFSTFFGLYLKTGESTTFGLIGKVEKSKGTSYEDFNIGQVFAPFKEEFFSNLAFIGTKNYEEIFVTMEENNPMRMPLIDVFLKIKNKAKRVSASISNNKHLDGLVFENLVSYSVLLATHTNSFYGVEFQSWIYNFIQELNLCTRYEGKDRIKLSIAFPDDEFWNINKSYIIPFCPPALNGSWNQKAVEYLSTHGASIGITRGILGGESMDFYIDKSCSDGEKVVLSGECKLWNQEVGFSAAVDIIHKLKEHEHKTKWNVIVSNSFKFEEKQWANLKIDSKDEEEQLKKEKARTKLESTRVYLLKNISSKDEKKENYDLELKQIYRSNDEDAGDIQGFVFVDLKTINSVDSDGEKQYNNFLNAMTR